MQSKKLHQRKIGLALVAAIGLLLLGTWLLGYMPKISQSSIEAQVAAAGPWGPALIVILMMASIVASPIPSAPVALVSGATYGHVAGAVYVAIGSVLGALTAFVLARYIVRDHVERWLGEKTTYGLLGSQNMLMFIVFGSRLLPFISFDAMSYAAGLSRLYLWRFLVATLAGIIPASFALAHLGALAISGEFGNAEWLILGMGLMTVTPLIVVAIWRKSQRS